MYYGWRGKIGLILPSTNAATERDFYKYLPEGLVVLGQHIAFNAVTIDQLKAMGDEVIEAAKMLAFAGCDLLVYGCTTGSMVGGIGYDLQLAERVKKETGIELVTTSMAVLDSLKTLNAKNICLITPYPHDVSVMEKKFLKDSGYNVVAMNEFKNDDPVAAVHNISNITYDQLHKLAKESVTKDSDVIFMSCTGLGIIDQIDISEKSFNRPVIASNYVTLWKALQVLGIEYDGVRIGRLMPGSNSIR